MQNYKKLIKKVKKSFINNLKIIIVVEVKKEMIRHILI